MHSGSEKCDRSMVFAILNQAILPDKNNDLLTNTLSKNYESHVLKSKILRIY